MRRLHGLAGRSLLAAALFSASSTGCVMQEELDVCQQAQRRFQACGVTMPLFAQQECSSAPEAIAECVLDIAEGCNELSTALQRFDKCIDRLDDGLPPLGGTQG